MPRKADLLRHAGAFVVAVLGTCGVVGLSLGMNAQVAPRLTEPVTVIKEIEIAPKARSSDRKRPRRAATPRRAARAAPSPSTLLAANLSGLDFGLGNAADAAIAEATEALVGAVGGAVMDEEAVEVAPRPRERTPPAFPARARSLGQSGWVTLSFVVDIDGSTQDVHVVDADPPAVFDEAALAAVRGWRFDPGQEAGSHVAVRVRQTLRFELQ